MVTGMLSSHIQRTGGIDEQTVKNYIDLAKTAYDYINESFPQKEEEDVTTTEKPAAPIVTYSEWTELVGSRYTDIVKWLKTEKGITSNRKIDDLIKDNMNKGGDGRYYIAHDPF